MGESSHQSQSHVVRPSYVPFALSLARSHPSRFQSAGSQQWSGSQQGFRSMQGSGSQPSSSGTPSPSPRSSSPRISRFRLQDSSTEPNSPPSAHASDLSEDDDPDDVRYDRYHRIIIRPEGNGLSVPRRTGITVKFVKIESTNAVRDSLIPSAPLKRLKKAFMGSTGCMDGSAEVLGHREIR
nr:uncharacterized protein LOC104108364 [Nicotiana tomentosiformis]